MEAQVSLLSERGLRGRQGRALTLGLEPHPAPWSQEHAKNRLWLLGSWALGQHMTPEERRLLRGRPLSLAPTGHDHQRRGEPWGSHSTSPPQLTLMMRKAGITTFHMDPRAKQSCQSHKEVDDPF